MSTEQPKISKPKLRLVLEDSAGDLVQVDVQTDNRDAVRFDVLRARKNWPGGDTAPMLWLAVQAWSAIKRSKLEPWASMNVDKFVEEACVDLLPLDADGNPIEGATALAAGTDALVARPTDPAIDSD